LTGGKRKKVGLPTIERVVFKNAQREVMWGKKKEESFI